MINKNLFEPGVADEILNRVSNLSADTKPLWGKMSVAQMVAHCQAPTEIALGDKKLKKSFIGFLFGKIAKKQLLEEKPFKKSLPTAPEFVVKNERKFEQEKQKLETLIHRLVIADKDLIASHIHPFFGKMTAEQWGILNYKHLDHHLRQFGA
ncbi:MAG: hypothetical protein JWN76_1428 [Chitinophagaceae bacterium]|nr:hypothetical protein [Chitinophagaceae bacterium]